MSLAYSTDRAEPAPPIANLMERVGLKMTFAKGEEIFGQDQEADMIHSVVSGAVRTSR